MLNVPSSIQEIEVLEKPVAKTVDGIGPTPLLSPVTEGRRRIELEEGSLRGKIRDPSAPTNGFMELFEGSHRPGTDSDCAPTSVITPLLMRVSQERS